MNIFTKDFINLISQKTQQKPRYVAKILKKNLQECSNNYFAYLSENKKKTYFGLVKCDQKTEAKIKSCVNIVLKYKKPTIKELIKGVRNASRIS